MMSFREFVSLREAGVLPPVKPPSTPINPFPTTDSHLARLRKLAKPTVRPVAITVPKIKL
jgi:hypothetical protein